MREVQITEECFAFIESQPHRVSLKFYQIIEVITEVQVVHSNFVKKLQYTEFYELRIKAGPEVRVILFTLDHHQFTLSGRIVCLNGFIKKSTKDYKKAINKARKLLNEYNPNR